MRLHDGKYIITDRNVAQARLNKLNAENELLRAQLDLVMQWTRAQLQLHTPYISELDISCAEPEEMVETLVERIKRNIWCSRCSNPWPCKHIGHLRSLRNLSRRFTDMDDLKDFAEKMPMPLPAPRKGQLDVGL